MPNLKVIKKPLPLAKIAYQALRNSILNGNLVAGEIYNEMALAKELGVSRTPVREALLELSAQELVVFLPRKGVKVNPFSRRDVEEIFELRMAIELAATENVAKHSPPRDLSKLMQSLKNQRKAMQEKDYLAYLQADRMFHSGFSELTGNRRFVSIMANLRDMVHLMGRQALARESRWHEVIEEHKRVLDAVSEGRPLRARKAMAEHIERSKQAVLEQFNASPQ